MSTEYVGGAALSRNGQLRPLHPRISVFEQSFIRLRHFLDPTRHKTIQNRARRNGFRGTETLAMHVKCGKTAQNGVSRFLVAKNASFCI